MGSALVAGWLSAGRSPASILIVEPGAEARAALEAQGVCTQAAPGPELAAAETLVIAVKPALVEEALASAQPYLRPDALVVSIAAGVTLARLEAVVPDHPVVRAMPNTPALVGMAATAIAGGANVTAGDLARAEDLLGAVGLVVRVEEPDLEVVTGVSGSGPAYVFALAEAMIAAGVRNGLTPDLSAVLVARTLRGAAEMLERTGETPEALRAAVTSPNGTTAAAIAVLEDRAFHDAVIDAIARAIERSRELGTGS